MVAALFAIEILDFWHIDRVMDITAGKEAVAGDWKAYCCSNSNSQNDPSVEDITIQIGV